jgi:hypothetical protein
MRTTVTLEPDVERMLKRFMQERGLSFKEALNTALRDGLTVDAPRATADFPTFDLGKPERDLTHALRVAADLEDDEIVRKMSTGR